MATTMINGVIHHDGVKLNIDVLAAALRPGPASAVFMGYCMADIKFVRPQPRNEYFDPLLAMLAIPPSPFIWSTGE